MPSQTLCQNSENWRQFSSSDSACLLAVFLGPPPSLRFGIWWGDRRGWSRGGRDGAFLPKLRKVATTPGTGHPLPPRGLLGISGPAQMFHLVTHADFRVPAAAELSTELPFSRQKVGRAAGSVQTPKALLATSPTPQSSNEETSGQASIKKQQTKTC